jgi:hypothetical protein
MLPPEVPGSRTPAYRGAHLHRKTHLYRFRVCVLGIKRCLGCFRAAEAEQGARKYDSLQLLLYGARAKTNFEWSTYTRADIAAAASLLQAKGLDVHQAVIFARQCLRGGKWFGVHADGVSWTATMFQKRPERALRWCGLSSAEAAARRADAGQLAVVGLGCTTNFPASSYTKLELEEAGRYATSKGMQAVHVAACLEAVEQVCVTAASQYIRGIAACRIRYVVVLSAAAVASSAPQDNMCRYSMHVNHCAARFTPSPYFMTQSWREQHGMWCQLHVSKLYAPNSTG